MRPASETKVQKLGTILRKNGSHTSKTSNTHETCFPHQVRAFPTVCESRISGSGEAFRSVHVRIAGHSRQTTPHRHVRGARSLHDRQGRGRRVRQGGRSNQRQDLANSSSRSSSNSLNHLHPGFRVDFRPVLPVRDPGSPAFFPGGFRLSEPASSGFSRSNSWSRSSAARSN